MRKDNREQALAELGQRIAMKVALGGGEELRALVEACGDKGRAGGGSLEQGFVAGGRMRACPRSRGTGGDYRLSPLRRCPASAGRSDPPASARCSCLLRAPASPWRPRRAFAGPSSLASFGTASKRGPPIHRRRNRRGRHRAAPACRNRRGRSSALHPCGARPPRTRHSATGVFLAGPSRTMMHPLAPRAARRITSGSGMRDGMPGKGTTHVSSMPCSRMAGSSSVSTRLTLSADSASARSLTVRIPSVPAASKGHTSQTAHVSAARRNWLFRTVRVGAGGS
jgi:hypothetical protein